MDTTQLFNCQVNVTKIVTPEDTLYTVTGEDVRHLRRVFDAWDVALTHLANQELTVAKSAIDQAPRFKESSTLKKLSSGLDIAADKSSNT